MGKAELGTKRLCPNCGAKYYDLNRDPVTCPKCNALFATGLVAVRPQKAKPAAAEEDIELDTEEVDAVSLDEIEAEDDADVVGEDDTGVVVPVADVDEDVDDDDAEDGAPFLDDDDDDEVADVVDVDVDDDDER